MSFSFVDVLGWVSSLILLGTILNQIHKQWQSGSSKGVSWFLFIGQILASTGFIVYSVIVDNLVFIVTNSFKEFGSILPAVLYYSVSL
jgi:uncharacterized protein with PQ loop repeat